MNLPLNEHLKINFSTLTCVCLDLVSEVRILRKVCIPLLHIIRRPYPSQFLYYQLYQSTFNNTIKFSYLVIFIDAD